MPRSTAPPVRCPVSINADTPCAPSGYTTSALTPGHHRPILRFHPDVHKCFLSADHALGVLSGLAFCTQHNVRFVQVAAPVASSPLFLSCECGRGSLCSSILSIRNFRKSKGCRVHVQVPACKSVLIPWDHGDVLSLNFLPPPYWGGR